ncbi:MAG: hypothetical protein WC142_06915 [Bacteroidales bacterium]|jgi:hypothetical protein|nr:hypothetical protein [Bacteroidales bacterium]MDD4044777.1 hypothetical protein [Bacteroidales bacterium]NLO41493.1 hypothetical protein [Bacteroidales bacterium]
MILKKRKKQGVCLLIAVALTLIMLSCASRSMMPKKRWHRCNDCPTFSFIIEKQNTYACGETNKREY